MCGEAVSAVWQLPCSCSASDKDTEKRARRDVRGSSVFTQTVESARDQEVRLGAGCSDPEIALEALRVKSAGHGCANSLACGTSSV